MASKEKTRARAATTIREEGRAHGALAGCVKIVTALNVAMSAGGCAYAMGAGQVAPAAGLALAAVVSAFMLRGGAA